MKKLPIHQNLNTSFVNVAALVRYLARLQFVGSIRIELASYEAEIVFTSSRTIQAREYDHITGRISHGKKALERIMVRAREPYGRINVYKFAPEGYAGRGESVFVDKSIAANARKMAHGRSDSTTNDAGYEFVSNGRNGENAAMLAALSELLQTIDKILGQSNLSFAAAFHVACESITDEYTFLSGNRNALMYRDGSVLLNAQADAETIASAVFAALRPIFRRLKREPKYDGVFRQLTDNVRRTAEEKHVSYQALDLMKFIDALLEV